MTAADHPQRPQHQYLQPECGPAQPGHHEALQRGLVAGGGSAQPQPTQELLGEFQSHRVGADSAPGQRPAFQSRVGPSLKR